MDRQSRTILLIVLAFILVGLATWALAGEASAPANPGVVAVPLSPEARVANVQTAMTENKIGLRPTIRLGDDGRLIVGTEWVDLLAR